MTLSSQIASSLAMTVRDVAPIALIIVLFQVAVLRRRVPNLGRVVAGFVFVVLGLGLFLVGLELALFPLGESMARQLSAPAFLTSTDHADTTSPIPWYGYYWTYLFAFSIGFSATLAEPALLAVAIKAHQVSGGAIHIWGLRSAVAVGSGLGVALGTFRIVTGIPLPIFIVAGYILVIIQTYFAPKQIVPLAYDSGGVTTSTVTVPLVTALGLGVATQIPGRSPLAEGFGMIALAVLFPMITVMTYAQIAEWWNRRGSRGETP